ncbi:MAG TPA: glutathione transferase [Polyangiaceae bacterium]
MALTLYTDGFFISPYAFSVFVALEEKGVPYTLATVSLADQEQHRAQFLERTKLGRVPVIDHDGFWLAESAAIVDYLDEVFTGPRYRRALPEDVQERARARMVMHWIRSDLMELRQERPTTTIFYAPADQPLTPAGDAAAKRLVEIALRLVPEARSSLFGGWCIADSDLAFMLQRLLLSRHDVPGRLRAFVDAQWARPSVQKWVRLERPAYRPY